MKQRKEATAILTKIEDDLSAAKADSIKAEARGVTASAKKIQTDDEYSMLRKERQAALGRGEDVTENTRKLKECQERLELAEDEVAGLKMETERLSLVISKLNEDREKAETEVLITEFQDLAKDYNTKAAELAPTVKRLIQVRLELERRKRLGEVFVPAGWGQNALHIIPRIFLRGEDRPSTVYEETHFNNNFPQR